MPRPWTTYTDPDSTRLPEGMSRVGYDADTQRYTYQDADGSRWVGGEGNRYGIINKIRGESPGPSLPSYKATARQKAQDAYESAQRKAERKSARKAGTLREKKGTQTKTKDSQRRSSRRQLPDEEKDPGRSNHKVKEKDAQWRKAKNEYGVLTWQKEVGQKEIDDDIRSSWRYLTPFITLCVVVVLWMFWLTNQPDGEVGRIDLHCIEGSVTYTVKKDDTCWDIAQQYSVDVAGLKDVNRNRWDGDTGLTCEALLAGEAICVPILSDSNTTPRKGE